MGYNFNLQLWQAHANLNHSNEPTRGILKEEISQTIKDFLLAVKEQILKKTCAISSDVKNYYYSLSGLDLLLELSLQAWKDRLFYLNVHFTSITSI